MAIEMVEGDFMIRAGRSNQPLLRINMTDDSMYITATETGCGTHRIIADISEAKELRDWLSRRLAEPI